LRIEKILYTILNRSIVPFGLIKERHGVALGDLIDPGSSNDEFKGTVTVCGLCLEFEWFYLVSCKWEIPWADGELDSVEYESLFEFRALAISSGHSVKNVKK
jgi:hypothetical protein